MVIEKPKRQIFVVVSIFCSYIFHADLLVYAGKKLGRLSFYLVMYLLYVQFLVKYFPADKPVVWHNV